MTPTAPVLGDDVRRDIAIKHLQQLDALAIDDLEAKVTSRTVRLDPLPRSVSSQESVQTFFDTMVRWSENHLANIKSALYFQVSGGRPDWNCIFLAFLESAAMYLRDDTTLLRAVVAYRKGDIENALKLHAASYVWIRALASIWLMDFVMVCDLVDKNPVGHDDWDGPFCGVFYNANGNYRPSMGIAFKGTAVLDEVVVDYHYTPVDGGPYLKNIKVAHGVQVGLFGQFKIGNSTETAWGLINQGVAKIRPQNSSTNAAMVYVTGHSLGASYATLCWLALHYNPIKNSATKLVQANIFTFGSPRIGLASLLDAYANAARENMSWRIVNWLYYNYFFWSRNYQDLVTQVPPISGGTPGPPNTVFLHIDNGISIYSKQPPVRMPSEKGTVPQYYNDDPITNPDIYSQAEAHRTEYYYASLDNILTNGPGPFKGDEAVRCEVAFGDHTQKLPILGTTEKASTGLTK